MISDSEKKFTEKYFGQPYNEILAIAEKNLKNAGVDEGWIKKILDDDDGVSRAYKNDIPENLRNEGGNLYLYMTTVQIYVPKGNLAMSEYDKEWYDRVESEHPNWTDEQIKEYMDHVVDVMFDWDD